MNIVDLHAEFSAADYTPKSGSVIFNVGGNKYRVVATIDFTTQILFVQQVLTHEEYDRQEF
jgi:mRNA interferase HigB